MVHAESGRARWQKPGRAGADAGSQTRGHLHSNLDRCRRPTDSGCSLYHLYRRYRNCRTVRTPLYAEAWDRGWNRAKKKVVLGDGAEWIWNIADQHFAGALQIVDIWHAREHLWDLAAKLYPSDDKQRKTWAKN